MVSIKNNPKIHKFTSGKVLPSKVADQLSTGEDYLYMLRQEEKFTCLPSAWELAQAFKENRDAALSVRNRLVKELAVYKPWLCQHPFNINYMKIDPRTQRVSDLDKFLNFTRIVESTSDRITQGDIERAKVVSIESLYSFKGKGKKLFCPFHDDIKNPSAAIKDNKFHCFTCNVHYDSIEFVKQLKGLSFVEAVERLR